MPTCVRRGNSDPGSKVLNRIARQPKPQSGVSAHMANCSVVRKILRRVSAVRKSYMLLAGMALCTGAGDANSPVQSYDIYKSWLIACDNTLRCEAKGFDDQGARAELSFSRAAGPQGKPHAVIAAKSHSGRDDILLDGQKIPLGAAWER